MTIEREALLFLIAQIHKLKAQQEMDSVGLIQVEAALQRSPIGATIDDHLQNAKQIVRDRREPGIEEKYSEIIRALKEI